jgi:hypothetical protein
VRENSVRFPGPFPFLSTLLGPIYYRQFPLNSETFDGYMCIDSGLFLLACRDGGLDFCQTTLAIACSIGSRLRGMAPLRTSLAVAHVHSGILMDYMLFYARAARNRARVISETRRNAAASRGLGYLPLHPWPLAHNPISPWLKTARVLGSRTPFKY